MGVFFPGYVLACPVKVNFRSSYSKQVLRFSPVNGLKLSPVAQAAPGGRHFYGMGYHIGQYSGETGSTEGWRQQTEQSFSIKSNWTEGESTEGESSEDGRTGQKKGIQEQTA
jgi:hypothetical protein